MGESKVRAEVAEGAFIIEGEHLDNPLWSWSFATEIERLAATGFVIADLYKIAVQTGDHSFWKLVGVDPIAWQDAAAATNAVTIKDEGTPLPDTPHGTLDFTGNGVIVTNAGGGVAEVAISGGGSVGLAGVVYVDTDDGNAELVYCESVEGEIELVEVDGS